MELRVPVDTRVRVVVVTLKLGRETDMRWLTLVQRSAIRQKKIYTRGSDHIGAMKNRQHQIGKYVPFNRTFLLLVALLCACHLNAQTRPARSRNTFLIVSDIHFNPMFDAALVPKLVASEPAQWEAILGQSKKAAFSQYGEDTNWWLLQSSFKAMRATLAHPAFIMTNGDMLAHQFPKTFQSITHDNDREDYRKFVRKTIQFLALQFRKAYPEAAILVTPGNNDDECGNYAIYANGEFLHDTAELASKLAHAGGDFTSSWEALGSYDIPNPAIPGAHIISLNSIFLSELYHAQNFNDGCAVTPTTAPDDVLSWLESRLNKARQAHEKVWLMFHIPPGIDSYTTMHKYQVLLKTKAEQPSEQLCDSALVPMWAPKWTSQFDDLLVKYKETILASFAGHTHSDDFRIIDPSSSNPEFVLISASISPVYNQNPSFRTVTFAKDGTLIDSSVYYLTNLTFASSTTPGEWEREYTFSQQWKVPRIDGASLATVYGKVTSKQADSDEWLKLYNVSSSAVFLPANAAVGFECAIEGLAPDAYTSCYCKVEPNRSAPGSVR